MRNLFIAAVLFAPLCLAQTGVVKSEGQVIQGATVKATQGDRVLLTLTGDDGSFHFDGMTPGAWIVEVDMFGFEHARKEVQIGASATRVDFTMQLRERTRPGARRPEEAPETDVTGTVLPDASTAAPPGTPQVAADGSNESFLVNGSLSQGLQTQAGDLRPDFGGLGGGLGGPGGLNAPLGGNPAGGPAAPVCKWAARLPVVDRVVQGLVAASVAAVEALEAEAASAAAAAVVAADLAEAAVDARRATATAIPRLSETGAPTTTASPARCFTGSAIPC